MHCMHVCVCLKRSKSVFLNHPCFSTISRKTINVSDFVLISSTSFMTELELSWKTTNEFMVGPWTTRAMTDLWPWFQFTNHYFDSRWTFFRTSGNYQGQPVKVFEKIFMFLSICLAEQTAIGLLGRNSASWLFLSAVPSPLLVSYEYIKRSEVPAFSK